MMQHVRFAGTLALCALLSLASPSSYAQCNTFQNADSANLIFKATPNPGNINYLQFTDIDGDGDEDCYLLDYGAFVLYRNVGTKAQPRFVRSDSTGFETSGYLSQTPYAFADMDGDGDPDFMCITQFLIGGRLVSETVYYKNTGTLQSPHFEEDANENPLPLANRTGIFNLVLTDINGDGLTDAYVTLPDGQYQYQYNETYLNSGTKTQPQLFFYASEQQLSQYAFSSRTYYDFNKDGLPDYEASGPGGTFHFRNVGTVQAPAYDSSVHDGFTPVFENGNPLQVTDLNSDGAPEGFTYYGAYSTVAPVAIIKPSLQNIGQTKLTKLTATHQQPGYTYSWQYNGRPLSGYHKPILYALKKGAYTLTISNGCGTGNSLPVSVPVYFSDSSAVQFAATEKAPSLMAPAVVKVYPNPFVQSVTVQMPAGAAATVRVADMQGRILITEPIAGIRVIAGNRMVQGIYLLQIVQNGKVTYTQKLVKE